MMKRNDSASAPVSESLQHNHEARPEARPEVGEVMDYIRHIFKALRVSSSQFEKDIGLSAAQIFVMKKLKDEPGLSINDLANRTVTHQSSVSVVVKKLEEQKLVQRSTSKEDSRKVVVYLTQEGEGRLASIPKALQENMIEVLHGMSAEKTMTLAQIMKEFVQKAGIVDSQIAPMFDESK